MRQGVDERHDTVDPTVRTRLRYLYRLSRPQYWFHLTFPVLAGVVYAAESIGDLFSPLVAVFLLYFLIPGNLFGYGVNDAFDRNTDEHNPRKSDDGREVQFRDEGYVWGAIALSGASLVVFVPLTDSVPALSLLGGWALVAVVYSAPPIRLKSTPPLDSLMNGAYILPGIAAYTAVAGSFPPAGVVAGFWIWTMGYHTISAIPDIDADRAAGVRTLATVLDRRRSLVYVLVLWTAAPVAFAQFHPLAGVLFVVYPVVVGYYLLSSTSLDRVLGQLPIVNAVVSIPMLAPGVWPLVQ